jgi:hypothetical protein
MRSRQSKPKIKNQHSRAASYPSHLEKASSIVSFKGGLHSGRWETQDASLAGLAVDDRRERLESEQELGCMPASCAKVLSWSQGESKTLGPI